MGVEIIGGLKSWTLVYADDLVPIIKTEQEIHTGCIFQSNDNPTTIFKS